MSRYSLKKVWAGVYDLPIGSPSPLPAREKGEGKRLNKTLTIFC
jgi:hypothetical protein